MSALRYPTGQLLGGLAALGLMCAQSVRGGHGADAQPLEGSRVSTGYAPVNGLQVYYEIWGEESDTPLVLMHGGGSTIETSFQAVLAKLAAHRRVIAFEQQGHGRTADVDRPFTFEQSAEDAAALLGFLGIESADICGYSNGGHIAMRLAMTHPELVRKQVITSAMFTRDGADPAFWPTMDDATLENMPGELKEAYVRVAPRPEDLPIMFEKCRTRMREFRDWPTADFKTVRTPTLIMLGDEDIVRPEHGVELYRLLPDAELAILPGTNHMSIVSRADWQVSMIETFLDEPNPRQASLRGH